ncbi:MAG: ATP phosphoribosyltransferase regulatory subunit, partial [Acetivibrio sp.]
MMEQYKLLHTPEGVRDIYNGECERKIQLQEDLKNALSRYGYQSIETPSFEFFDIFSEERGTISSKEMYKFIDREGNTLVLRPDMTPSIARCAAKYFKEDPFPLRLLYTGNTFINNGSHQGKLNEVTQVGAELMNDASVEGDSEILALTVECLLKAGLKEFQVEIGHADFFNGLMEEGDFKEEEVMQIKSLMESKNLFGIEALLGKKELNENLKELLLKLPELFGNMEYLIYAKKMTQNKKALKALERLEEIVSIMDDYGMLDYITIDLGMLSKYNYYTGIIMKAYTYAT